MARFINDSDYSTLIRDEIKDILLEDYDEGKLLLAENMAIAQVKNHLKSRYNLDVIFEAVDSIPTPDPRNSYILMICIDCTLYHLYSSIAPNMIPEHRSQRYEDALKWLISVGKGQMIADLPLIENEDGKPKSDIRIGSKYSPSNQRW